jgi:gluconolactonase
MPNSAIPGFDIVDPRFKALVLPNAPLEQLADGFRWLEGPVWFADHDCLLFSDLPNDRIMRWTKSGGASVFRQPAGFPNGHARDRDGKLIGCSHRNRRLERTELDGTITVLADRYNGRRLNAPNDVVVKRDGTIWFTDPHYGINTDYEGGRQEPELPPTVYRLDPGNGALTIVADDFQGPNGLCFSPDESRLYISETGVQFAPDPIQHIRVFDLADDGVRLANPKLFHTVNPGAADGFRCDEHGNIWSSAADGVHCIDPSGNLLGKVLVPSPVANLAFGGRNRSRLFICAGTSLHAIYLNTRGVEWP